ncbi:MAG: Flp pilus assembly complex ATPase component TadA [Gemmataceae bacterium]|nr:Flp pilus assembly complex ATPase component TadA [Gemmataceae bacterium]MBJ7429752.1 Flp pilus assembly complex ATPase component TadA [Gemmataceae bacterium]
MAKARGDYGDILVKNQVISSDQLQESRDVMKNGGSLQDALLKLEYANPLQVAKAVAEFNHYEFIDLTDIEVPDEAIKLMTAGTARESNVVPISTDGLSVKLAVADPSDFGMIQKLSFIMNKEIVPVVASLEQIRELIDKVYPQDDVDNSAPLIDFSEIENEFAQADAGRAGDDSGEGGVIKLVNKILSEGVELRASDIHIEPFATRVRIRYRVDGVLVEKENPPYRYLLPILSRLKIMAGIDISEKRRPQDGRIKTSLKGRDFDLRLSLLPTVYGQSAVMRILDRSNIKVNIRDLGLAEDDFARFQNLIKRPNGIFLVTGPTGSGKTTTLYSAINELNTTERKIITAEDPVEYYLPGINQCEVKHNIGLDFARIIRAMLRQAPNVILVGEIRDAETAKIAIEASLTGHLVFSTLHTNDAPSAITRLIDIGVQPFLVASSIIAVMAQRLVRRICPKCKEPYTPTPADIKASGLTAEQIGNGKFVRGKGCSNCNKTGYRGRQGIYEMLRLDGKLREMAFKGSSAQEMRRHAKSKGMRNLLDDGMLKVCKGMTTFEEVLSTCHHDSVLDH